MNKILNGACIGLAVALIICLLPMPYGYYNLVRFIAMATFCYMTYVFYQEDRPYLYVTSSLLTLLFQPFFKIALGRTLWNIVDVIVAIALIILCYTEKNRKYKNKQGGIQNARISVVSSVLDKPVCFDLRAGICLCAG